METLISKGRCNSYIKIVQDMSQFPSKGKGLDDDDDARYVLSIPT